jgi:hypothetical protein
VLVDDVTRSEIFAGQQSLEVMRAAGSMAVHTYPLLNAAGEITGMLNFHYRNPGPPRGRPELVAAGAARALTGVPRQTCGRAVRPGSGYCPARSGANGTEISPSGTSSRRWY